MEETITKIDIGDRVMTKRIGMPTTGTVVARFQSPIILGNMGYLPQSRETYDEVWGTFCPDYIDEEILCIELDTPHKAMSRQEVKNFLLKQGWDNEAITDYAFSIQVTTAKVFHPVADVELL